MRIHPSTLDALTAFLVVLVGALVISSSHAAKAPPAKFDPPFGAYWHDGKAELDGYRYSVARYGRARRGQAILVYVTEPFSRSMRVKVDNASRNPKDTFDVLKLNLVRDFQTGIYDYNTMTSLFVKSEDFDPVKVSFVSTEWCGNVYEELLVNPALVSQKLSSYFEGESGTREERRPKGGILEEELFTLLRGLHGPYMTPGESRTVPFLPSSFRRRLTHEPLKWTRARIDRVAWTSTVTVPAGTFTVIRYSIQVENGPRGLFHVDSAYPHRIVRWEWPGAESDSSWGRDGNDSGQLTGSARLKYWELHKPGDERWLARLGLTPRSR